MHDVDSTFGALLIGLQFSALLFGILTLQLYLYYRRFYQDPLVLRLVVGILWFLTALHLSFISHAEYHHLVTNHIAIQENNTQPWTLLIHIGITSVIVCVVQCFFIERLWDSSRHNVALVLSLLPFMIARLVIGLATTITTMRVGILSGAWVTACFASLVPTDVLICVSMLYFLRTSHSETGRTERSFSIIILYTLGTGMLPCLLSIAALICYLTMRNTMIFIAIHFVLGQLYPSSMLVILNGRHSFGGKGDYYYPSPHFLTTVNISEGTADATRSDITPTHATDSIHAHNRRLTQINTLSAASLEFRGTRPRSPTTPVYHVLGATENIPAPDTPGFTIRPVTPLSDEQHPPRHAPSDSGRSHMTGPNISWESLQSTPVGNFELGDPMTRSVVPGVPQVDPFGSNAQ